MKIYGIKTCDTCRKAVKAFEAAGQAAEFVDFRQSGLEEATLDRWLDALGWEALLNRRSTSWRALSDSDKADIDRSKARSLMLSNPTLIKRPVFEDDKKLLVGFGKAQQQELLG